MPGGQQARSRGTKRLDVTRGLVPGQPGCALQQPNSWTPAFFCAVGSWWPSSCEGLTVQGAPRPWQACWARAGPVGADLGSPGPADTVWAAEKGCNLACARGAPGGRLSARCSGHPPGTHSPRGPAQFPAPPPGSPLTASWHRPHQGLSPTDTFDHAHSLGLCVTPRVRLGSASGPPRRFWPRLHAQGPRLHQAPPPCSRLRPHARSLTRYALRPSLLSGSV